MANRKQPPANEKMIAERALHNAAAIITAIPIMAGYM